MDLRNLISGVAGLRPGTKANNLLQLNGSGQIPAVSGALLTNLPVPTSVADRLTFLELNLAINTLRDQIDTGWSVLKMVDGVADEFEDTTGIGSSDGTYDATGDYIHNPGGYGSNVLTGGTATGNDEGGGAASNAFDGNTGTIWSPSLNYAATWVRYQLGSAKTLTKYQFAMSTNSTVQARLQSVTLEGSNNGSSWTALDTWSNAGGWGIALGWNTRSFTNSTAYLYYRWTFNHSPDYYVPIAEMQGFETVSPANITVVSTATTAEAGTTGTEARIVLLHQPVSSVTLNTDVTVEVSRDNGTTWTTGTLANEGAFDATTNVLTAVPAISAQPAGTSMKWRYKTLNNKEQRLHGVWLQWR